MEAVQSQRTQPDNPQADFAWLWHFIAGQGRAATGAIVFGMIAGVAAAANPYLIGAIIDHIRSQATADVLARETFSLIGLSIVSIMAFFGQRYYSGQVAYKVNYDVRRSLFDNLLTLDQGFYQRYPTGDLISRMNSDTDMIWRLLILGFTRIGSASMTLLITAILLGIINIPLTLVVFTILTISTSVQIRVGLILAPVFERVQNQTGVLAALAQDAYSGIQTIKTFGREEGVARQHLRENAEYRRRWLFFKRRNEPVGMLPNMISELTAATVVLFGGIMALNGSLTLGNFVQYLLYLAVISQMLLQLGTIYQRYQQTRGALTRLSPLLGKAQIADAPDARPLPAPHGEITFKNVSVKARDSDQWLLRDISLHIEPGKVVAFVGPTGCGKTLLVSLLARVLDPDEGHVLIDGMDVRSLHLEDLRRAIAYVPQSTFLFSKPLHHNVRMGKPSISDDELESAIHISRVSNDLTQLPQGLDTMVGEKGVMLSGGQKQRVAIARAVVREPTILVLDDALSSVDTQTAAEILGDLRHFLQTRTSLIIAHRIATVKDADHIVVMDEGRIVERGTHATLIAQNGFYARMVERELKQDEETIQD